MNALRSSTVAATIFLPSLAVAAWTEADYNTLIPMRDGQALAADVYLPPEPGRYPTILIQTPYNRKAFRTAATRWDGRGIIVRERYAYVILDWRGYFDSKPAAVRRADHGRDGYDAVEWIAAQEWSDGKVGTWGASALGKVQFMTAKQQPPHLVCCVPIVAAEGQAYEDFFMDGVFRQAHAESLVRVGFGGYSMMDRIQRSPTLLRLLANSFDQVESVNVPLLMITGWYDHSTARQIETFRAVHETSGPVTRANSKLLIGPWHHSAIGKRDQGALSYPEAEGESDRVALQFFDYWLRDQRDSGWAEQPTFRAWQINEGRWLSSDSVTGPEVVETVLHMHSDGRIDATEPAAEPPLTLTSDPENPVPTVGGANLDHRSGGPLLAGPHDQSELEGRDDVLVFTTDTLDAPLRIHGSVAVQLTFSTDRPDATFAVRMCDVYPDGRSMLVVDGVTRAKNRGGPQAHLPVVPGETYTATVTLPPAGITISGDHRLRISVAPSNHPRFELNPHTGADRFSADTAVSATYTLHSARLTSPTLP